MDNNRQDYKNFLEEQLQWCKDQESIYEKIDLKLHEMKKIAEYSLEHKLTTIEVKKHNGWLNELNDEVHSLKKQLHSVVY